jgi:CubicO group peptidase (beta-lactamase class C family)
MSERGKDPYPVSGRVAPRFGGVRRAFEALFAAGEEQGAAFAVFIEGEPVVDLVGGFADRAGLSEWNDRTLACVYSSGKLALAMLAARAVGAGLLDYDRPVADVWPEFAAAGKDAITLGDVLSHQAGLVGFADPMPPAEWTDFAAIVRRIAAMAPLFPPRTASGYSPQIFGFVIGELLRRATGRGVAQILREDFWGDRGIDIHCGLAPPEIARAAAMQKPSRAGDLGPLTDLKRIAFLSPWAATAGVSRETWMAAEIPSSNIHATAGALAEIIHPLADEGRLRGHELVSPEAAAAAARVRIAGDDLVLPFNIAWAAGFMRNTNGHFGPSPSAYGHAGHGGSAALFDPERRLSAAYVMGRMSPHLIGDPRAVRLFTALYEAL